MWSRPVGKGCLWRFCCHGKTCTAQRDRSFLMHTVESYADVSHPSTSANQLSVTRSTSAIQLSVNRVLQPVTCQSPEYCSQSAVSLPDYFSQSAVSHPSECYSQSAVSHPNTSANQRKVRSVTAIFSPQAKVQQRNERLVDTEGNLQLS